MPAVERATFLRELGCDAQQITDLELELLLRPNWRYRTVAGWVIGLDRRERFRRRIGELLMASELTYAYEGYCIALGMLGTHDDAALLSAWLNRHLRLPECRYDQPRAPGILRHLDDALGRNHAGAFLEPGAAGVRL